MILVTVFSSLWCAQAKSVWDIVPGVCKSVEQSRSHQAIRIRTNKNERAEGRQHKKEVKKKYEINK